MHRRLLPQPSRGLLWGGILVLLTVAHLAAVPVWGATNRLTGDEPHYLMTAESLLSDGDLDLRDEYAARAYVPYHHQSLRPQERPGDGGQRLSPHGAGLPALVLPGYALGGWVGARIELALLAAAVLTGAGLLADRFVRRPAWATPAAVLAAGLSLPLWVYSTQVYPELPAAGLLVLSALLWTTGWDRRHPRGAAAVQAGVVLVLLLLGFKYLPVSAAVALVGGWRLRSDRAALGLLAGGISLGLGVQVLFNLAAYGGATPYSTNVLYADRSTAHLLGDNTGGVFRTYRLHALLFDRHYGLVRYAPVWLAAVAGAFVLLVEPRARRLWWPLAALLGVQWATATWLALTMRGYWFPGRQVVTVLPLLVPALAFAFARLPAIVSALAGLSVVVGVAMVHALDTAVVGAARNPFWLPLPGFAGAGGVFPDYRDTSSATSGLAVVWLCVVLLLSVVLLRRSIPGVSLGPTSRSTCHLDARVLVAFPARNEETTIADVVRRALSLERTFVEVDVVVVDDGSSDTTAREARSAGARVVAVDDGRTGLGAAARTILAEGVRTRVDWIVFMDADGEYAPEDVPSMAAAAEAHDLDYVTGNRFAQGGRPEGMPLWRNVGNRAGSLAVSCLAGRRIRDAQSGIRLLSGRAASAACIPHDYNYAQVLTLGLLRKGFRMGEIPVSYARRSHGQTFVRLPVYLRKVVPAIWQVMAS